MITENRNYENISIEELNDIFQAHLSSQQVLPPFPSTFSRTRNKFVQWLIQICQKLYLKPETMHRSLCMFDAFISMNKKDSDPIDLNELKLVLVACLSLSTKLNELNANYIKFFTDQLLNAPNSNLNGKRYSYEDLSLAEMSLVGLIDYNLNAPNVYHFNSIFIRICLIKLDSCLTKESFMSLNTKVLNSFLLTEFVVQLSAVNSAIMVLNETLSHFYNEKYCETPQMIISKIQAMLLSNQITKTSMSECTPNISVESSASTKIDD